MNSIFSYFLPHTDDDKVVVEKRKGYAFWFEDSFPETEFRNEDLLFYNLVSYANNVDTLISLRVLTIYTERFLKTLIVKKNIHVTGTETLMYTDPNQIEEAVKITSDVITNEFIRLSETENNVDEFKVDADVFMQSQLNERLIQLYSGGFEIISSLKDKKMGAEDALEYTTSNLALIEDIYDKSKLEELDVASIQDSIETTKMQFISDSGLQTIDDDCKGIFGTQLFGIEAPPGVGKTKFATGTWAYRAAVVHKRNVLYIALEQSEREIRDYLLSRHIYTLFRKQISADLITKNQLTPELYEIVEIARQDLFESGKYGKIHICAEGGIYYENFINKLKSLDKLKGPFDMILIDYMTLIEQRGDAYSKALKDYEIAKRCYRKLKQYLRATGKCAVAVNQLNAEGTKNAEADKKTSATGAAGGMETYRSTDYNLVLSKTEQLEAQLKRRISNAKSRSSAGFGSVIVDVRMGIGLFYQTNEKL